MRKLERNGSVLRHKSAWIFHTTLGIIVGINILEQKEGNIPKRKYKNNL